MLIQDSFWNKLRHKRTKTKYSFLLTLHSWERNLWYHKIKSSGEVDTSKFFVKRNKEKHLFRKFNWYWFNDSLLRKLDPDTLIVLKVEWVEQKRMISVEEALEVWKYLTYSKLWYEKQIFIPFERFYFYF